MQDTMTLLDQSPDDQQGTGPAVSTDPTPAPGSPGTANEPPKQTVSEELAGLSSAEIRNRAYCLDEQLAQAEEKEDEQEIIRLEVRKRIFEKAMPLALAIAEHREALQALNTAIPTVEARLQDMEEARRVHDEAKQATARVQQEEEAAAAGWRQAMGARSQAERTVQQLRETVEEKAITVAALESGRPREEILKERAEATRQPTGRELWIAEQVAKGGKPWNRRDEPPTGCVVTGYTEGNNRLDYIIPHVKPPVEAHTQDIVYKRRLTSYR